MAQRGRGGGRVAQIDRGLTVINRRAALSAFRTALVKWHLEMLSFLLVLTTLLSTGCLAASSFSRPEAPAGSVGWHDAVRPHHLRALERDQQSQQRQEIGWANCPNVSWAEAAQEAGLLSVKLFGAVGNGTADDAPAVRRAMNASELCGGCVFFPPTSAAYKFDTTAAAQRLETLVSETKVSRRWAAANLT